MMHKKGQQVFVGVMVFIMLFIVAVTMTTPLKNQIATARDSGHLDCANTSISTGTKATCIVVDFTLFYFIGIVIAAGGGFFVAKRVGPRQ